MAQRARVPQARGTTLLYRGSDMRVLGTTQDNGRSTMRAVGTGKHPEGRFPEGQVVDLPEALTGGAVHPDYASFIDDGYLELLDPEDDPGRTTTQIANSIVRGDALSHPVDAKIADGISDEEAYAITHTGDPTADASAADPHEARKSTVGARGVQLDPTPTGVIPGSEAAQKLQASGQKQRDKQGGKRRQRSSKKDRELTKRTTDDQGAAAAAARATTPPGGVDATEAAKGES